MADSVRLEQNKIIMTEKEVLQFKEALEEINMTKEESLQLLKSCIDKIIDSETSKDIEHYRKAYEEGCSEKIESPFIFFDRQGHSID